MIEVYHLKMDTRQVIDGDDHFVLTTGFERKRQLEVAKAAWDQHYEKVAEVMTDSPNLAYRLTQNIDTSWSMEPDHRVSLKAPLHVVDGKTYGRKSSSVGDVFVRDGQAFLVSAVGFQEIK